MRVWLKAIERREEEKGILPEDLKLPPLLRLTDFLTLRFPPPARDPVAALPRALLGGGVEGLERAPGKYTLGGFSLPSVPAPHLYRARSHTYHLIAALSETVRKSESWRAVMFVVSPGCRLSAQKLHIPGWLCRRVCPCVWAGGPGITFTAAC